VLTLAKQTVPQANIGVAYTYNEPLISYEFVYNCAKLAHKEGLVNILVSNGYINPKPLEAILPFIDAMNIDLKSFSDSFYKKVGGNLDCVKRTIELAHKHCHVEVTTLIIPGENDSDEEIAELAKWLSSVSPQIPLHLISFFPRHKYAKKTATSSETIERATKVARKYLENVFSR
jgi:pyruvate formate lyase activating enzyme